MSKISSSEFKDLKKSLNIKMLGTTKYEGYSLLGYFTLSLIVGKCN